MVMMGQCAGFSRWARCSRRISQRRHCRSTTCWMLLALVSMSPPCGSAEREVRVAPPPSAPNYASNCSERPHAASFQEPEVLLDLFERSGPVLDGDRGPNLLEAAL